MKKKRTNSCYFPEDVLLEIFVRLPFMLICKFRRVSKSYLSLFTDPSFINMLFNKLMKDGGITPWTLVTQYCNFIADIHNRLFCSTSSINLHHEFISSQNGFANFEFHVVPKREMFHLASSNGLVLCAENRFHPTEYFICNPLSRQCVSLPQPRPNPLPSSNGHDGFIYESSTGTYKVIRIPFCHGRNFSLQIFSSDSSEWRTHEVTCSEEIDTFTMNHMTHILNYNRTWYWMEGGGVRMLTYNDIGGAGSECSLFDLPRESRKVSNRQRCLGESNGPLCYGQIEKVSNISVWVFQNGCENNESTWKLLCKNIELEDWLCVSPRPKEIDRILAFSPVDERVVILKCHEYEVAYNTQTRKSEMLCSSHPSAYEEVTSRNARAISRIVVTPRSTIIPTTINFTSM